MFRTYLDDPDRYASGKARKNYAGTSPLTRASGKKKIVMARFVHNDRLIDALMAQAFNALGASTGATDGRVRIGKYQARRGALVKRLRELECTPARKRMSPTTIAFLWS